MPITVKIRNKDRLLARLKAKVPKVENAIEDANQQSAEEMADMMRRLVPVDSGALRDSISVTRGGETTPGGRQVPEGGVMVTAGNKKAFYSSWVEFGTVSQPAQPFFYVSARANKKRARSRAGRALTKAMKG